jgi:hypothetical protein
MRADSLEVIILKQREIEKKNHRRKVRNFLKAQLQRDFNNYSRSGLTRS